MKLFCERHSEERLNHSLWVVINRYNPQLKGFTAAEIQELLGVPRLATIANDFRAVNLAINQGKSLRQVACRDAHPPRSGCLDPRTPGPGATERHTWDASVVRPGPACPEALRLGLGRSGDGRGSRSRPLRRARLLDGRTCGRRLEARGFRRSSAIHGHPG